MTNIPIKNGISIPEHELTFTASRSGGAGGQHVNKTSSRITLRWNIKESAALTPEQKERVMSKLSSEITADGEIIIHNSESRSQHQNKQNTITILVNKIRQALYVQKKRIKTGIPKGVQEKRLTEKKKHSMTKQLRKKWD